MNYGNDEKEKFLAPVKVEPGLDALDKNPDDVEFKAASDSAPRDR